jgi:hypothetical protein
MLSDCDAVILVQRFTTLRERELKIIEFTEIGDKNVSVADKLFVFLSRIDSYATPEALKRHLEEAYQGWQERVNLPVKRLVSGSAGAYLVLNDLAEKQTQLEIGDVGSIRNQMSMLTGIDNKEALSKEATGIPEIKDRIFQYINTERVSILEKRCEASIATILDASREICNIVRKSYPENPEDAKRFEEERRRILFMEWWYKKWEQIKADLLNFYEPALISEDSKSVADQSSIEKFRERYLQVVSIEMQKLRTVTLSKKDTIFAVNSIFSANSDPIFDRDKANFAWREDLYADVSQTLSTIAKQLAAELQGEALNLVEYMTGLLWGNQKVKEIVIKDSEHHLLLLENSLGVLFLRFARPVAEALIRGPVGSDTRDAITERLDADIEIVDNYYKGKEPAFRVLKRYVKYGHSLLHDSELRKQVLGVAEVVTQAAGVPQIVGVATQVSEAVAQMTTGIATNLKLPQETVVFEVENDINALEEYLNAAIFDAAGFESFYIQELKDSVDRFRKEEGVWAGVALNEWMQGNPSLLSELPNELRPREVNLEVSERLRQLSGALKNAQTGGFEGEETITERR